MLFPLFGAQMSGAEFQYHDLILKEPTSKMAIWLQKVGVQQLLLFGFIQILLNLLL
jgi:hypothetical protein